MAAFMPTYDPTTGTIRPIPMCVYPITFPSYYDADDSTPKLRLPNTQVPQQNTPFVTFAPSLTSGIRPTCSLSAIGPPPVEDQRAPSHNTVEAQISNLRTMMDGLQQLQQENHALRHSLSKSHTSHYDTSGEASFMPISMSDRWTPPD